MRHIEGRARSTLIPGLFLVTAACSGTVGVDGMPMDTTGARGVDTPAAVGPDGQPVAPGTQLPGQPQTGDPTDPTTTPPEMEWTPPAGEVFEGPIVANPGTQSRFSRLTHKQWERTVQDLLGLTESLGLSDAFVSEPLLTTFDNNGGLLTVSSDLWLDYQRAAEAVGALVAQDQNIIDSVIGDAPADPATRARAFVEAMGLRAYRRPLTETEVTRIVDLFNQGATLLNSADPFAAGVELVTSFLLQSPHFLYRAELSNAVADGKVRLSGYEVATRLSYGLLNTMPDEALLQAAATDQLQTRDQVIAQATRLLDSPRAQDTIADFHLQLLKMHEYETVKKNDDRFDGDIGEDLKAEALTFANQVVLAQSGNLHELLTASYTYGNGRISEIYGQDALTPRPANADDFARIDLDPTRRAGLLTQIGFLAANAEGATPNSILRGVHISRRVICSALPPPPNMIPPLPELSPDQTNRERVEALTGDQACAGCHGVFINPLGFGLEHFDGLAQYRDTDNGLPVDSSGTYNFDGDVVNFAGATDMAAAIANAQQTHECYAKNWTEYLLGRAVDAGALSDSNLVAQAGALSQGGAAVKELILQLVGSDAFLTRLP